MKRVRRINFSEDGDSKYRED